MNNINLVGRLTKDVELKYTANGTAVSKFTLAVKRAKKDANGVDADFINIICWTGLAEATAKYLSKGKQCSVSGRLQSRNYKNAEGITIYIIEVIANNVDFLSPVTPQPVEKKVQVQTEEVQTEEEIQRELDELIFGMR